MVAVARHVQREPIASEQTRLITCRIRNLHNQRAIRFNDSSSFQKIRARFVHVLKRGPQRHDIESLIFALRFNQRARKDAPAAYRSVSCGCSSPTGFNAEPVPLARVERAKEEA